MADSVMVSKREGLCNNCRGPIAIGEEIRWNRNDGAKHLICEGKVATEAETKAYLKDVTEAIKAWDGKGSFRPIAFGDWLHAQK